MAKEQVIAKLKMALTKSTAPSTGKLMVGPNERARSQYPNT